MREKTIVDDLLNGDFGSESGDATARETRDAPKMISQDRTTILSRARELFGDRLAEVILTHDAQHVDGLDFVAVRTSAPGLRPLASAVRITNRLREVASTDTTRAWFGGSNPLLNDEEPAIVVKTDPGAVWRAAKHFIAHA